MGVSFSFDTVLLISVHLPYTHSVHFTIALDLQGTQTLQQQGKYFNMYKYLDNLLYK